MGCCSTRGSRRVGRVKVVLADAGYDAEANHRIARLDMGVRSLIRTGQGVRIGRAGGERDEHAEAQPRRRAAGEHAFKAVMHDLMLLHWRLGRPRQSWMLSIT